MQVRSKTYPSIQVNLDNKLFQFENFICEMPDYLALKLVQFNSDYELIKNLDNQIANIKFNPDTWKKEYKKLIWDGPIGYNNGYGKSSMMMIEGLEANLDLFVVNSKWVGSEMSHISPNLQKILDKSTDEIDSFYVKFFPAWEFAGRISERYIGFTMLECTKIPQTWVDNINNFCERVIVPSDQQKEAFINSGVKRDIGVVPLGIIPEWFPYHDRKRDDGIFKFGIMGTLTHRKGTDILLEAFTQAFPKDEYPEVLLKLKTLPYIGMYWDHAKYKDDSRIDLDTRALDPQEILDQFFYDIDCFVFPTRGEGWGMPPVEAMSTGLPVICTDYSGSAMYMNSKYNYPLKYKLVDVPNGTSGGYPPDLQAEGQQWAEPDLDHLIELMKEVYNNQEKAKRKGKAASKWIQKEFSADASAKKLINYLDLKF